MPALVSLATAQLSPVTLPNTAEELGKFAADTYLTPSHTTEDTFMSVE